MSDIWRLRFRSRYHFYEGDRQVRAHSEKSSGDGADIPIHYTQCRNEDDWLGGGKKILEEHDSFFPSVKRDLLWKIKRSTDLLYGPIIISLLPSTPSKAGPAFVEPEH